MLGSCDCVLTHRFEDADEHRCTWESSALHGFLGQGQPFADWSFCDVCDDTSLECIATASVYELTPGVWVDLTAGCVSKCASAENLHTHLCFDGHCRKLTHSPEHPFVSENKTYG